MRILVKFVANKLAIFHTFPTLEIAALKRLESVKLRFQNTFERTAINLDRKKEKSFKAKDVARWELSSSDLTKARSLVNDKEAAYKAMFPRESQELVGHRDNFFFFVNQCYNEIRRSNRYEIFWTLKTYQSF